MSSTASPSRYGATAIALHWLLAVGIGGAFGVGVYMTGLPFSPARLKLYNWHKWAGVTILALSAARLLWRLANRPPALPASIDKAMPGWQRAAFHGTHHLMYLLFFAVPPVDGKASVVVIICISIRPAAYRLIADHLTMLADGGNVRHHPIIAAVLAPVFQDAPPG